MVYVPGGSHERLRWHACSVTKLRRAIGARTSSSAGADSWTTGQRTSPVEVARHRLQPAVTAPQAQTRCLSQPTQCATLVAGEGWLRPLRSPGGPRSGGVRGWGLARLPPCRRVLMADRRGHRRRPRIAGELADWRAKAAAAGVSLSALLREAMAHAGHGPPRRARLSVSAPGRSRASATTSTRSPAGPTPTPRNPRPSRSSPTWSPSSGRSRRWPFRRDPWLGSDPQGGGVGV